MSKNITVWRVQNEYNSGPYNGTGNIFDFLCAFGKRAKCFNGKRPPPWSDKQLKEKFQHASQYINSGLYSGFSSVRQYKFWFVNDEVFNALDATGYFLARYSVPEQDVHEGDTQVAFRLNDASIDAFRRCNEIGLMLKKADITHRPIQRFMGSTEISIEMSEL